MADDDYAPAIAPDEDEEELKRMPGGYAPASPPADTIDLRANGPTSLTPAPAPTPDTGSAPAPDMAGYSAPQPKMSDLSLGPAAPSTIPQLGAQRPSWDQYAPPEPSGWGKAARITTALLAPQAYPYVFPQQQRAEDKYATATKEYDAAAEQDLKNKQEQRAESGEQSKETKESAEAERDRAEAEKARRAPVVKTVQQHYAEAVQSALDRGADPSTDPTVMKLQDAITSVRPTKAAPGVKAVTLKLPSGQQVAGKVDHEGNLLTEDGKPAPQGSMLYQQPNYGQMVLPTKTIQVIGGDGLPHVMSWNEKTQAYDIPQAISGTGAYAHQMEQAGAIDRASQSLIASIRDNEKAIDKSKLGEWSTWVKKYGLDTPFADPTLARIQAEYKSFADLNPALHGYRSAESAHSFEQLVGGLQKNPEAAIASIQGLVATGAHAINPNLSKPPADLKPPKEPDQGMKWQHRTVEGKTEWRQVPAKQRASINE